MKVLLKRIDNGVEVYYSDMFFYISPDNNPCLVM